MKNFLHLGWCIVLPMYKLYLRISKRAVFEKGTYISYNTKLQGYNFIGRNSYVLATEMGYASYTAREVYLYNTVVGKYTCIGPNVSVVCGKHPLGTFISMHPVFFSEKGMANLSYVKKQKFEEYTYADVDNKISVIIGNDVWIGEDVKIMEGVTIGDGAVIAAGAVVLEDVPAYSVVAGVPGKIKKYRFDDDTIEYLKKVKWWDKSNEWIESHADLFSNIDEFKKSNI